MLQTLFSDVCWIIRSLKNSGHLAFITGGAVRDILLGRNPEDYDIATTATPDTILSLFPKAKPVGKAFGTTLVVVEHRPYQITTFQSNGGTYTASLEKDILRRDFTINALFWDPLEDRLIDLVGGVKDLKRRLIRPVTSSEKIFMDDPVRMLRAIRIASALQFAIEPSVSPAIRKLRKEIRRTSPERLQDELGKIFLLPRILTTLCPLVRTRLLFEIIPEMFPLFRLNQSPYHDFSALSHTFRTLHFLEKLLEHPPFPIPIGMLRKLPLMLAALLHDIGKPETHTIDKGYHHFYGHEDIGATMAGEILRRLRFAKRDVLFVRTLVKHHLYPLHLFHLYQENRLTSRAVTRFIHKTKRYFHPLLLLATADQFAKRRAKASALPAMWSSYLETVTSAADQIFGNAKTQVAAPGGSNFSLTNHWESEEP